jgi:hypothetical protein
MPKQQCDCYRFVTHSQNRLQLKDHRSNPSELLAVHSELQVTTALATVRENTKAVPPSSTHHLLKDIER